MGKELDPNCSSDGTGLKIAMGSEGHITPCTW